MIDLPFKMIRAAVEALLRKPEGHDWSLQGFGMLRLYLSGSKDLRLHIWDRRFSVAGVSQLHDHPWDFRSLVIAGELTQYRYTESPAGEQYVYQTIQCGPGGCAKSEPAPILLTRSTPETYEPGNWYGQKATEIHKSLPDDGSVSLIERTFKEDTEHARVFWKAGMEWISAEPRKATPEEVHAITQNALKWFV